MEGESRPQPKVVTVHGSKGLDEVALQEAGKGGGVVWLQLAGAGTCLALCSAAMNRVARAARQVSVS